MKIMEGEMKPNYVLASSAASHIANLQEEIEDLACCGNCNMKDCDTERGNLDYNFGKYCDLWCYDGQRRQDRRVK